MIRTINRALPLTIATAFFMEGLDSSVVTTALPAIARDIGTSTPQLAVTVTAYLISLAVCMPLGGWLAVRYGSKQVFMAALGIFALGSMLCGLAPDRLALIAGRIVQGVGGAMMSPVGRAILISSVPKTEYIRAMNYVIIPGLLGPAMGPLVGGFLATYASWHWIFLINLPLAAIGIALSYRFIDDRIMPKKLEREPFDWVGYVYLAVALGFGQVALELSMHGTRLLAAGSLAMLSVGAFVLFSRRFRRIGFGILDLGLLRIRTFRLSVTAGSVARAGLGGLPFLLPLLLQVVFAYDAFQSGLVTCLVAVGAVAIRPLLSYLTRRLGCRRLLLANSVAAAAGASGFVWFGPRSSLALMAPYIFAFGLLRTVQMSTMNALSYTDIEKRDMGAASTFATLAQRVSIGLGVNVAALVLALVSGDRPPELPAFGVAFITTAVLILVAGAMFTRLHATDGWQISLRDAPQEAQTARQESTVSAGPTDV